MTSLRTLRLPVVNTVEQARKCTMCLTPEMHLGSVQNHSPLTYRSDDYFRCSFEHFLPPGPATSQARVTLKSRDRFHSRIRRALSQPQCRIVVEENIYPRSHSPGNGIVSINSH